MQDILQDQEDTQEVLNRKERIKSAAADKIRESKEKAVELHTTAEDYVREHPTKCILGIFGLGLLIGLVIRR